MINLEAARIVAETPQRIAQFCVDLESYGAIDPKVVSVRARSNTANPSSHVRQRFGPLPMPRQVLQAMVHVTVDRHRWIEFEQTGGWLAQRLLRFRSSFDIVPLDEGSLVRRRYAIGFRSPFGSMAERMVQHWLVDALDEEMERLADRFNGTVTELDSRR